MNDSHAALYDARGSAMGACRLLALCALPCLLCGCHNPRPAGSPPPPDTEQARRLNEQAVQLISHGDDAKAQQLLERALATDPSFGPVRNNLGLIAYRRGDLYQAAWQFEYASRLMPRQPEPLNNLGLVLEKADRLDDAIDSYSRANQLDRGNPEYLGNLVRARIRRGDRGEEVKGLLQELVLKERRPDWLDWARFNLHRLANPQTEPSPTSRPDQQP